MGTKDINTKTTTKLRSSTGKVDPKTTVSTVQVTIKDEKLTLVKCNSCKEFKIVDKPCPFCGSY